MCGIWFYFNINNDIAKNTNKSYFDNLKRRGRDMEQIIMLDNCILGFHRLIINGLNDKAMQPFKFEDNDNEYYLMCNGEIYNHKFLESEFETEYYRNKWYSDCNILLPYFVKKCDKNMYKLLNDINGEFSLFILEKSKNHKTYNFYMATDPLSLRPLYYKYTDSSLMVSSLLKGLTNNNIENKRLNQYSFIHLHYDETIGKIELIDEKKYGNINLHNELYYSKFKYNGILEKPLLYKSIVSTFSNCVRKRLMSDKPICCLLSGGLDSSIVAALTQNFLKDFNKQLHTFSIGFEHGTDLTYAKQVADHIGSVHTEVIVTENEVLNNMKNLIYVCETYDTTTLRASALQYFLIKYISENTDFKVVLNGDGADELEMGYLYFHNSPDAYEANKNSLKLLENISKFDGLRVDRCVSNFNMEARFPFLDIDFVKTYYNIDASLKVPDCNHIEKYLFRKAFDYCMPNILPNNVLWRKKEAFSDGVSSVENSWYLKTAEYCKTKLNNLRDIKEFKLNYQNKTDEELYYLYYFNIYFGNNSLNTIPYKWMPEWSDTTDPSARTLNI